MLVPGPGVETNPVRSGSAKDLFQNPVLQGFRVDAAILFFGKFEIGNGIALYGRFKCVRANSVFMRFSHKRGGILASPLRLKNK
ncbi:hypothetical protein EFP84_17875 [Leptospira kmetyi]|uniref:Uncharacterized protein n=1 Tax=Leptospira kmetyi TaxID=408139 RepID=A0AAD0UTI9_9LEPT|nr:hypothetical protein EFP84_17875 [Leptospira kmetyi]